MRFTQWVDCMQLFQAGGVVVTITGAGFHPLGANRHTVLDSELREDYGSLSAPEVADRHATFPACPQHPR